MAHQRERLLGNRQSIIVGMEGLCCKFGKKMRYFGKVLVLTLAVSIETD